MTLDAGGWAWISTFNYTNCDKSKDRSIVDLTADFCTSMNEMAEQQTKRERAKSSLNARGDMAGVGMDTNSVYTDCDKQRLNEVVEQRTKREWSGNVNFICAGCDRLFGVSKLTALSSVCTR